MWLSPASAMELKAGEVSQGRSPSHGAVDSSPRVSPWPRLQLVGAHRARHPLEVLQSSSLLGRREHVSAVDVLGRGSISDSLYCTVQARYSLSLWPCEGEVHGRVCIGNYSRAIWDMEHFLTSYALEGLHIEEG